MKRGKKRNGNERKRDENGRRRGKERVKGGRYE